MKKLLLLSILLSTLAAGCLPAQPSMTVQGQLDQALGRARTERIDLESCADQAKHSGLDNGANTLFLYHYNSTLGRCFSLSMYAGLDGQTISIYELPSGPFEPTDQGVGAKLILQCFQAFPYTSEEARMPDSCKDNGHSFILSEMVVHIERYLQD